MCRAKPFSARALLALWIKTFSLMLILWQKTNRNVVYRGLYSYRQRVRVKTLFLNIVWYCFCMLSGEFAKVIERKVWFVQVGHLHNAARAFSSPSRCFGQLSTNLDIVVTKMALVKFHWFGINWHVFMQKLSFVYYYYSENRATSRIWKVLPNMVFLPIWGEKWRRSEHAHASYRGLSFRPPGFNPYMGWEEKRVFRDWTRT